MVNEQSVHGRMTIRRMRFYASLIFVHALVRYKQLSPRYGLLVTLWRVFVGVLDDIMLLLLHG
jgi:hypothetical protein